MTDEELLGLNESGFIPGPNESETDFLARVERVKQSFLKLGVTAIPSAHWDFSRMQLAKLFDFMPACLPAFYSNASLMPWQGAAAWVERGRVVAIQLRKAFSKGSFLKIYHRSEILSHEASHAARSAFPSDRWDEFFAYMTSDASWRRVLGPIIQRPWEVWPFLICSLLGSFFSLFFLGAAIWLFLGFWRLFLGHLTLRKAGLFLQTIGCSKQKARSILFRLTDDEIRKIASAENIFVENNSKDLRWRLIYLRYLNDVRKDNC